MGTWEADAWSMEVNVARAHLHGGDAFFGIGVGQDAMNSSVNIISVSVLAESTLLTPDVNVTGEVKEWFHGSAVYSQQPVAYRPQEVRRYLLVVRPRFQVQAALKQQSRLLSEKAAL